MAVMLWEVGWGCHRILGVEERAAIMAEFGTGLSQVLITHLVVGVLRWRVVRSPTTWILTEDIGLRKLAKPSARPGVALKKVCWIVLRFFVAT